MGAVWIPERIEQKFPGMPFVQAEVLHAVADAYWGVGEDERSRSLIDRAVALYRATCGDRDPATLKARKSQIELSSALPDDQYDALLASYVEDATQVFGPRDRQVIEGRIQLANRPVARKRPAEAIPGLKKLRTELTELLGPTDVLTLTCGAHIAFAYAADKQFTAAVREMESLRETGKGMTVRFDHPLAQAGDLMLADIYRASGNIQKAIEVYEEILDNWKQRGQPYHGNTWATRHLLAWIYARNGNLAKGAALFEANVAAAPTSFNTYLSLNALCEAEAKLGRDDKALVERARQGLAAAHGNRGANYKSWVTGHARIRLGQQLLRTKEYAEAEQMLTAGLREMIDEYPHVREYSLNAIPEGHRSLLDLYQATNRPENERYWLGETLETIDTLVKKNLAEGKFTPNLVTLVEIQILNHIAAGRHDDAVAVYREVNARYAPPNKAAADAWLKLSGSVLNGYEGKLQNDRMVPWAEFRIPVLERNLDAVRKTKPSEPALLSATNALLFSYLYAGRKADVVSLVEEVIDRQKANGWRTDAQMVGFYGSTAKAVALAGRPDLAAEISSAVLAGLEKSSPSAEVLATATFSLGFAQSHAGEHAEAERHFREAVRLQLETDAKHWKAAKYKSWLGLALHDLTQHSEAEPVLKEAYAEWEEQLASAPAWEHQHPLLIAGRLANLYEANGKPDEAAKWKAISEPICPP
jgi:tetratricopeptide (TPR) repeat protein